MDKGMKARETRPNGQRYKGQGKGLDGLQVLRQKTQD